MPGWSSSAWGARPGNCCTRSLGGREGKGAPRLSIRNGTVNAWTEGMSDPRTLRCYEYLNRPYDAVRRVLRERPLDLFRQASRSAAARATEVASSLHTRVAGIELGVDVTIYVHAVHEEDGVAGMSPVTRVVLGWEAMRAPMLFPVMRAELSFWPLTSTETQFEIEGTYRPPLGAVGNAADAVLGHRIAEATVHQFLEDIVEQLRSELPEKQ